MRTKKPAQAKTKKPSVSPKLKRLDEETYHVVGTQFSFMSPDLKTAKIFMGSSLAHQWLSQKLTKQKVINSSSDLPSTDSSSFLQKAFYYAVCNIIRNLYEAGVPLNEAISVGNQLVTSKSPTLMEFAPYAVISKVIREQIREVCELHPYK